MKPSESSILTNIMVVAFAYLVDNIEDVVRFDLILQTGFILGLLTSSFIGAKITDNLDDKSPIFYFYSLGIYTLLALLGILYTYLACQGLSCLFITILMISIPIVAVFFAIGTFIARKLE